MRLSERAKNLKPSPTLEIAAKAKALSADGHDVISLSVGEPDWDTYPEVKRAGILAIEKGQTKYSPANGLPALRKAVASMTSKETGVDFSADEVTISVGAKFILFSALQMLVNPGDEVLIPVPYWVSYPTMAELAGGVPVLVETDEAKRFQLTRSDLEHMVTPRTRVLLLNSPNNPSGEVYSRESLAEIASFLKAHPEIFVLSDDIYNRLVFDAAGGSGTENGIAPHLLHVAPELKDRMLIINGVSKTFSMTGWRLGWAVGPVALVKAMSNYQSQSVSCASPFTQAASLYALENGWKEVAASNQVLRRRRDYFVKALNEVPGLKVNPPGGAFYLWVDARGWMGKSYEGRALKDTRDIAMVLLDAERVAVVPGAESGVEGFLRISFALDEASIEKACARLKNFAGKLS